MAEEWSPSNDTKLEVESLQGRTVAVLRGEDPVLQLLNTRIKGVVQDVVVQNLHQEDSGDVPAKLQTGRSGRIPQSSPSTAKKNNTSNIERLFCQRGLGFFASELALVATRSAKIVDLVIDLYWEELLDKLILEQSEEAAAFAEPKNNRPNKRKNIVAFVITLPIL